MLLVCEADANQVRFGRMNAPPVRGPGRYQRALPGTDVSAPGMAPNLMNDGDALKRCIGFPIQRFNDSTIQRFNEAKS
jgi:hypothetical protein